MNHGLLSLALCLVLLGCTSHTDLSRRIFKDPFTGTETMMRDVRLDNVEITALDSAPSAMTIVTINGSPVAAISCVDVKECDVDAFFGRTIGATLQVSRDNSKPPFVRYSGTSWDVWDHNGTGQPDMRLTRESKVIEILIDGGWKIRRSTETGKERRYYVEGREVLLGPKGWYYAAP